jgi:hypothetical protein
VGNHPGLPGPQDERRHMTEKPIIASLDELCRYASEPAWTAEVDFSARMGLRCLRNQETGAMIVIDEAKSLIRIYSHVIALYDEWLWRHVDDARPLEAQLNSFRDCFARYIHLGSDELDYTDESIDRIDEVLRRMAIDGLELDWELLAPFSMYVAGCVRRKVGGRIEFARAERSGPVVVTANGRKVNVWYPIFKHFFDEHYTALLSFLTRDMASGQDLRFEGTSSSDVGWTTWEG